MSHLDSQTGTSAGLASQILWRKWARQSPNCISLGADVFSVEVFTDGVMSSGFLLALQIDRGLQLFYTTEARREMQMVVQKIPI